MDSLNLSQVIFFKQQLGVLGCTPTKINEKTWMNNQTLYPNPANEEIFIDVLNDSELNIELFSVLGQRIETKNEIQKNKIKIDLSDVSKGFYIVRISEGLNSVIKKIIKE